MKTHRIFPLILLLGWIMIAGCSKQPCPPGDSILLRANSRSAPKKKLYVVSIDGSGTLDCAIPKIPGDRPVWSPDGEWIAYDTAQIEHPIASQIYVRPNDSNKTIQLSNHDRGSSNASWSPNKNIIAYSSGSIYMVDVTCLYRNEKCAEMPTWITVGHNPKWSPDGSRLAFERYSTQAGRILDVWIMNVTDTKNPKEIRIHNTNGCYDPAWSPDGTKIALSCSVDNGRDIYVLDLNTNLSESITQTPNDFDILPTWSSDGETIAFISTGGKGLGECLHPECAVTSNAVFIINTDGNNRIRLTHTENEQIFWHTWFPE